MLTEKQQLMAHDPVDCLVLVGKTTPCGACHTALSLSPLFTLEDALLSELNLSLPLLPVFAHLVQALLELHQLP